MKAGGKTGMRQTCILGGRYVGTKCTKCTKYEAGNKEFVGEYSVLTGTKR